MFRLNSLFFRVSSIFTVILFTGSLFLSGCGEIDKLLNKKKDLSTTVTDYNTSVASVVTTSQSFLVSNKDWEGADFNSLSAQQVKDVANAFLVNGDSFTNAMNDLNTKASDVQDAKRTLAPGADSGSPVAASGVVNLVPGIKGVSPGLANNVAETIQGAKDGAAACDPLFDSDPNAYKTCMDKLRQKQLLKAAGIGISTVMGTGAAIIVGGAATAAAAPAAIVIGGAALAGVVVGKTVSWLWSKCGGGGSRMRNGVLYTGESCSMSTGQTNAGTKIPSTTSGGGTLVIAIPGYVPVTIENFNPPADGRQITIDFTPIPIDQAGSVSEITIDYSDIAPTASSCSDVFSVTAVSSPSDPGPGQSVDVIATLFPAISGCSISFSIVGTDGYSKSGSPSSNSSGQASFHIPGGADGVHDVVSVGFGSSTYTVTYTF